MQWTQIPVYHQEQVTAGQAAGRGWIQVAESPDALDEIKNAIGDADKIGLLPQLMTSVAPKKCRALFGIFTSWNSQKQKRIPDKSILHSPEVKITIKRSAYNIQILCEQSLVRDPMRLKSNSPCSLKDKAGPQWYQNVSNIIKDHLEFDLKMSRAYEPIKATSNQEIKKPNQKI